ncbi:MAG: type III pantothenate kinase [Proteobacteria bacterium]|jgi:type III pantothenate kinase|nr:type III pantothenate kinase [Pseudomonadota bacterium]
MLLCLDIGNSQLCGGVFDKNSLLLQFRYDSKQIGSSDQLGVFMRSVLRENNLEPTKITSIGIASVVPSIDYTVRASCIKYFKKEPLFLKPGIKTGIQIKTHNPIEVGSDLIAGAIAAKNLYPEENILIFDLGTATTCSYLSSSGEYHGVSIAPGINLMMTALQSNTAKLFGVNIVKPESAIGKNTKSSIQSGIYYAQLGLMEQLIKHTMLEYQLNKHPMVIGTGGFSQLFSASKIFDHLVPELVILGIKHMLEDNQIIP